MSIYNDIKEAFPTLPITDLSAYYDSEIGLAKQVYQGSPPWKKVKSSGLRRKTRDRSLTGLAKVVCDKMAALTFSEQCSIECAEYQELIDDTLNKNAFWSKFPEWLSRAFALGGGIIKIIINNSEIVLNYVNPDVFYPVDWDNRRITSGIFRTTKTAGKSRYTLFELSKAVPGGCIIENKVFKSETENDLGIPVKVWHKIQPLRVLTRRCLHTSNLLSVTIKCLIYRSAFQYLPTAMTPLRRSM